MMSMMMKKLMSREENYQQSYHLHHSKVQHHLPPLDPAEVLNHSVVGMNTVKMCKNMSFR